MIAVAEKSTAAVVHARRRPRGLAPHRRERQSREEKGREPGDARQRDERLGEPRAEVRRLEAAGREQSEGEEPVSGERASPVLAAEGAARERKKGERQGRPPDREGDEGSRFERQRGAEACLGCEVGDRESGADAQGIPHATGGDRGDHEKEREGHVPGPGARSRDVSATGRNEDASGGVGQERGTALCRGLPGVGPAGDTE